NVCDVCSLFGSPQQTSRIFFSDAELIDWSGSIQVRDGVCIDRDSETARPRAKYDFEVIPRGAVFFITVELENPQDAELALVGAALSEWENGFRLGGFTSRGLGKVSLSAPTRDQKRYVTELVDYSDPKQLRNYLLFRKMTPADSMLSDCLRRFLAGKEGADA